MYFSTVRNASTLKKESQGKATLGELLSAGPETAASKWGLRQLVAHRVICSPPSTRLALLEEYCSRVNLGADANECIRKLIHGPPSMTALANSSEPQIVQQNQPDSLGYTWAALLPFLRPVAAQASSKVDAQGATDKRRRKAPERYEAGVPSDQADLGSSPSSSQEGLRPATSASDSSFSSAGHTEALDALLLEDSTIHLARCFVRCVLNHGQPQDQSGLFLEFRDERLSYSGKIEDRTVVHAVDDGGIQVYDVLGSRYYQVAMLEGKRSFQKIVDGEASVTDENLGQMVGEALALALQSEEGSVRRGASRTDFVTILATTHYMRFFHFHISPGYLASYQSIVRGDPDAELADFLRVNSTPWLDMKEAKHRKVVATFLLALVHWANQVSV